MPSNIKKFEPLDQARDKRMQAYSKWLSTLTAVGIQVELAKIKTNIKSADKLHVLQLQIENKTNKKLVQEVADKHGVSMNEIKEDAGKIDPKKLAKLFFNKNKSAEL